MNTSSSLIGRGSANLDMSTYGLRKNSEEIGKFFRILTYMGLVKLPTYKDYWQKNELCFSVLICKNMTRDQFHFILSNIHFSDVNFCVSKDIVKNFVLKFWIYILKVINFLNAF